MVNSGFPHEFIEEVKERNDIVSVMSKSLTLEKKGRNYWACCPFHFEKTPSLAINENEQFYHCFGCGESGDVIKFVQKYENVSFYEAVKILAEDAGMELPEIKSNNQDLQKLKQKEKVLLACKLAQDYYISKLNYSDIAKNYLKKREINPEIASHFKIGFSPDWQGLIRFLNAKNIDANTMKDAGLVETNSSGNYYDVFATRLIFPICNSFGDCIGFTARSLETNPQFAKYRNSTQTLVFDKSRTIYNIDGIRELKKIQKIENIIICEGTIDVIAMYRAGIKNAVACMGTAITEFHARELKRYADKILLCLDGDSAGQNATYRAIDILTEYGLEVRVIHLRDNLDPDEFLKTYGAEALKENLTHSLDAYEYKIDTLSKRYDLKDNFGKNKFVLEALKVVDALETFSQKEIYLKIISHKSGISVDVLRKDLTGNITQITTKNDAKQEVLESHPDRNIRATQFVIASIVHKKAYAERALESELKFDNRDYQRLFDFVLSCKRNSRNYTISSLFDYFDTENNETILNIINFNFAEFGDKGKEYFDECLNSLGKVDLKKKQEDLLRQFNLEKDNSKRLEIAKELGKIAKEIKNNGKN